jgi:hypothetical protein
MFFCVCRFLKILISDKVESNSAISKARNALNKRSCAFNKYPKFVYLKRLQTFSNSNLHSSQI